MLDSSQLLSQDRAFASSHSNALSRARYLVFFSMLYLCIMICNAVLTKRYVSLGENIFVLGGALTSPLTFILADIVAELFGYKIAQQLIVCGFLGELLFALICWLIIHAPYPLFFKDNAAYFLIFSQLIYIVLSSLVAFVISSLLNVYIVTRWKILLGGRYFWLRSLGASTIAEAIFTIIAVLMMELGSFPLSKLWKAILVSYSIKVAYSLIFSGPGNMLVNFIKKTAQIEVYEQGFDFNPFKGEYK